MGEAAALAAALSWAAAGVAVTSLSTRLPAAALSALQMVVASAALLLVLVVSGETSDFADTGTLTLLGVAGSGVVGFTLADPAYVRALSIVGMQRTYPVTIGLFIVLTSALGVLILDERFTFGLLGGGALIGFGSYWIVVPGGSDGHEGGPEPVLAVAPGAAGAAPATFAPGRRARLLASREGPSRATCCWRSCRCSGPSRRCGWPAREGSSARSRPRRCGCPSGRGC